MTSHGERIVHQFTKQAPLFQTSHRRADSAIAAAIEISGVSPEDTVLDVACGPGVLACAFARVAKHVSGVDMTPTMLEHARKLQASAGLANLSWQLSDVNRLPFDDGSFSMVVSRYAFHHFERPRIVLGEMVRVCTPGGKVVIVDAAPPPGKAAAFNAAEKMRDPSHTWALTEDETASLMAQAGLTIVRQHRYGWEVTAESLMERSFPSDGDRDEILHAYAADVGRDALGMNARRIGGVLHVTFPTLITVARK